MTMDAPIKAIPEDCPEQPIDAEIAMIANLKLCASDNIGTPSDVPGTTSGKAAQEEGVEV
jgi:hypothetical protein